MTDTKLKSYADRIDRLEEEKKAIGGDVKDVYTEVKAAGYNTKALRKVLADRRKKTDAQMEADMEIYRAALGAPGATYRSVADKLGMTKSKLHRLVPNRKNGTSKVDVISPPEVAALPATPPHDPETGEINDALNEASNGGGGTEAAPGGGLGASWHGVASRLDGQGDARGEGADDDLLDSDGTSRGETGAHCDAQGRTERAEPDRGQPAEAASSVRLTDTRTFDEITGPLPARLRRVPA